MPEQADAYNSQKLRESQPPKNYWLAISGTLVAFFVIGLLFLPRLGLEYDEVGFLRIIFHPETALFSARIAHHLYPLMEMSYVGAVKIWLYWPLLKLWHPNVYVIRVPVLILATLTILLVSETIRQRATARAAVFTGALLATDITFLLCSTFDWGPVVIQNFLLSAALYLLLVQRAKIFGYPLAAFTLGLALWDKAIFLWIFVGLCLSGLVFGFPVLRREVNLRRLLVAGLAFTIAIYPLIVYNVKRKNQTLGNNAHFTAGEVRSKFTSLEHALNGVAFHEFLSDRSAPAKFIGDAELRSRQRDSTFTPSNWRLLAFSGLLAAGIACAKPGGRRVILWLFIAAVLAWLQAAFTIGAGGFVHHVVIFYPALFIAIGLATEGIADTLGHYGMPFVIACGLLLCGAGLNNLYSQFRAMRQFSPTVFWTDADAPLARYLAAHSTQPILIADWGIANQADVLTNGTLPVEEISFALKDGGCTQEQARSWGRSRALVVLHTANHEMFANQRGKLAGLAQSSGLILKPVTIIRDSGGHPMFEIDQLSPLGE